MPSIHSHYENLKVARNAPPEVVRAAYKALSQKFHPDRNLGDAEAARIMAVINASYDVLSDPVSRAKHDRWIDEMESRDDASATVSENRNDAKQQTAPIPPSKSDHVGKSATARSVGSHLLSYWFWYAAGCFLLWQAVDDSPQSRASGQKPYASAPDISSPAALGKPWERDLFAVAGVSPSQSAFTRPSAAPNGQPWPAEAAYVPGYPRLHMNGLSSVTVDNSRNDADVFVKLVFVGDTPSFSVRQFYIPAFGQFTAKAMRAGEYDARYRNLATGRLSRSDSFVLTEIETDTGTRYSRITMTLYAVQSGNMKTHSVAESEF